MKLYILIYMEDSIILPAMSNVKVLPYKMDMTDYRDPYIIQRSICYTEIHVKQRSILHRDPYVIQRSICYTEINMSYK